VVPDRASGCSAEDRVMACHMAADGADGRTFQAPFGRRIRGDAGAGEQGADQ